MVVGREPKREVGLADGRVPREVDSDLPRELVPAVGDLRDVPFCPGQPRAAPPGEPRPLELGDGAPIRELVLGV